MGKSDNWDDIVSILLTNAQKERQTTKEFEYREQRLEHINQILESELTKDQRQLMDEIIFENGLVAEHETEVMYQQGFRDCVWMLKKLGVLE